MIRAELRNLIRQLGGPTVVGKACGGISSQAVSHWLQVPLEHAPVLVQMAKAKKLTRSDGTPYTCELLRPDCVGLIESLRKPSNCSLDAGN